MNEYELELISGTLKFVVVAIFLFFSVDATIIGLDMFYNPINYNVHKFCFEGRYMGVLLYGLLGYSSLSLMWMVFTYFLITWRGDLRSGLKKRKEVNKWHL